MKKSIVCFLFLTALTAALFAGGSRESAASGQDSPGGPSPDSVEVFVTILPQKGLVERIGGEYVTVTNLVKPGESPHSFEPSPRQIMRVGEADVFFTLGFPFERQIIGKLSSAETDLNLVPADEGVTRRKLETHSHKEGQSHEADRSYEERHEQHGNNHDGEGGEHKTGGGEELDPHIWLGPEQLKVQAENIYKGLSSIDPQHKEAFEKNFKALISDLQAVDKKIASLLKPLERKKIFVFHPAFGYFCDHYGLEQVPIEIEGKSPTPRQIENIIAEAKEENIRIIFVQPQFDKQSTRVIAEAIDGAVVPMNALPEDVVAHLEQMAEKIASALE